MKLGTPLIAIAFLLFNCSDEDEDKNEDNLLPTTEYYFIGKVDNVQVLVEEKDDIEFIGGFSDYGANGEECYGSYKSGLYKVSDSGGITLTPLQIAFYNVAKTSQPCSEATINEIFLSQLTSGDYQLSWIENEITTVGLHYYDSNKHKSWSSIYKQQNGESFFTVEKTEFLGIDDLGKKLQKVEGKFSSYLYEYDLESESVKDSIFISNAEFVYKFISE